MIPTALPDDCESATSNLPGAFVKAANTHHRIVLCPKPFVPGFACVEGTCPGGDAAVFLDGHWVYCYFFWSDTWQFGFGCSFFLRLLLVGIEIMVNWLIS